MAKGYHDFIREDLARIGRIGVDPEQVEYWMRLQYGTLDHLDKRTFLREVRIAVECIDADPESSRKQTYLITD